MAAIEPTGTSVEASVAPPSPGQGYVWAPRVDPNCGEYGLFVNQNNEIRIEDGQTIAVTGMRIILNNHFASMPVCGHNYASAQFIGRGSTEFSMQLAEIGDQTISYIQAMHEELEENARIFRRFEGAARVRLSDNQFLRLAGIQDGIITSVDTETDSGGTNLYRCQISFTSDGHHGESFDQEIHVESDTLITVIETLLTKVNVTTLSPGATRARESDAAYGIALQNAAGAIGRTIGEALPGVGGGIVGETLTRAINAPLAWLASYARGALRERQGGGVGNPGQGVNVTTPQGILETLRTEITTQVDRWEDYFKRGGDFVEEQERRGAYLLFPIRTDDAEEEDNSAIYTVMEDREHPWVDQYTQRVVDTLTRWMRNLPPRPFFHGSRRGVYKNFRNNGPVSEDPQEGVRTTWVPTEGTITNWPPMLGDESSRLSDVIYGRREYWATLRNNRVTGRNSIEGNLAAFEQEILAVAQLVLGEALRNNDFHEVFPGVQEQWINAPRLTANPSYPDLQLPAHPVSNLVIDTEPDFYFFNDGEEGFLNEIGPDIVDEMKVRVENMESSFGRLASGVEWRETYLGRSRVAVANDFNEQEEISLDDQNPYRGFDGSSNVSLDTSTTEGANNPGSWGRNEGGGRAIGGGTGALTDSIVDQVLGMSATVNSTQGAINEKLTKRRISMMRRTSFSLPRGTTDDQNATIAVGPVDNTILEGDRSHSFNRNAVISVAEQSVAQAADTTLTMRRAFPTFKLYFVEDDLGSRSDSRSRRIIPNGGILGTARPIMFFDDLYNYNSVKSIRLIRSRKTPTELLVLTLTNVQGLLERRQWSPPGERDREIYAPGFEDTELENPLKKIIMKEGLKVQLRLGYNNDPNKMGIKFVGEVVEFSYNAQVSDEVTIICQSYGAELALEKKGITPGSRNTFVDTPDLLHTLMCSPELVHFGRFELNPQFNPAEARNAATSRNDPSTGTENRGTGRFVVNPREIAQRLQEVLVINRSKWILANNPADDNIFAPGVRDHLTGWNKFKTDVGASLMFTADFIEGVANSIGGIAFLPLHVATLGGSYIGSHIHGLFASAMRALGDYLNDSGFQLSGQTIWETLKECELRHPGWIGHPRPYGTRQTLFFGVPSHRYWADQQTRQEMVILQRMESSMDGLLQRFPGDVLAESLRVANANLSANTTAGSLAVGALHELASLNGHTREVWIRTCREMAVNRWMESAGEYLAKTLGRFRPFRRYHLLTSDHHILINNIRASKRGTFNAVSLQYGGGKVYTLKADDSIPDELTRVQGFNYPSCDNTTLARRYCIGLLNRHLKDIYKGEIIVTGMDVDVYDQCYLNDDRVGMYGIFEIEQIVDTFTPETGWITEITPDLISGTNEWATRATSDARSAVLGALTQRYMGERITSASGLMRAALTNPTAGAISGGGIGGGAVLAAGAGLTWMGLYHIVRWTQDRQPIWVCPLILGERPFFSGLDGFRQDGIFAAVRGRLHASFDNVSEGWRQYHLAGYANDIANGFMTKVAGQNPGANMKDITDVSNRLSNETTNVEQDRKIKSVYGHVVDVLSTNNQNYYIALVAPEDTNYSVDTQCQYIPLEDSASTLAANYGPPESLIGFRVRVDYYGLRWRTGVGKIVSERSPKPTGNLSEMPTRGFRFAVAGGGSI